MDLERALQNQKLKDIQVTRWVSAMVKIASRILVSEEIDPTKDSILEYFESIKPYEREEILISAKKIMRDEFEELYSLATIWGFDKKSSVSYAKKIIEDRYSKLVNSADHNFHFLDKSLFGHRS